MQTWIVLSAVFGALLASFANVLIYRLPNNINLVIPATSFCPSCKTKINWYDKVPIFSWLFLKGNCRHCGQEISMRYIIVEMLGALFAVLACFHFGFNMTALTALLLFINLMAIAIIDWQHQIIPHTLTISGMVIGLALAPYNNRGIEDAIIGAIMGACIILLLSYGYKAFTSRHGMGGGDILLLAMIGTYFGPVGAAIILFVAAILVILFVTLVRRWRIERTDKLSLGSFLSVATILMLLS
ncbi:prepilin peptidase [Candidatus Parcubacteria bacterium]|jgi:leader peptidase (prepilin peptidase)/N-methyltransferase|nr:prepilin peptidase [Candidatus Parcubacteria bacterium]MBT7228431.1 prepilin peptidase [Candidatus Parcubacteria bacterium]